MLAITPPMGWNTWNTFGTNVTDSLIRESADAIVDSGLLAAGYNYVVIDDGWEAMERDSDGRLAADPVKFPNGIKPLADYVHSKGLKFGIYSCAGTHTCAKYPASYGNEEIDAETFASWGADFLKYDCCYKPAGVSVKLLYRRMGQALRATGRPILYSACNWGKEDPWKWAAGTGSHMWRTTADILDNWESIEKIGFNQDGLESFAGPNRWNDPDMLVVGMYGNGNDPETHTGCTDVEYRTHFTLWSLLASPLMIGCDVRNMNDATKEILMNPEVIAVNQDKLGRQGARVDHDYFKHEVWWKPLSDGSVAVGLFNRFDTGSRLMVVAFESIGIHDRRPIHVRDLWNKEDLGVYKASFSMEIEPHGCGLVKLTPLE